MMVFNKKKDILNKKVVFIFCQKDFNDNEFLITAKKLEKNGIKIFKASPQPELAIGQFGYKLKPEIIFENLHVSNFDALILIGGSGVYSLLNNEILLKKLQLAHKSKKIIAAICGAVKILANAGLFNNNKVSCFPADIQTIKSQKGIYTGNEVEVDGNFITAKDETVSEVFAELILNKLKNERK